ncbi:MAG TPA: hypothetical protein VJ727_11040 [Rhodanobacteraceae bacterium]|nr:hypothetical protein [Rhodanobacteraceae bacterium]
MRIHAAAPGKLVLCGEYAVLEGAPALVLAVDAQARVSLEDANDGASRIAAPDVGVKNAHFDCDSNGRVRWKGLGQAQQKRLNLVARIIEAFGSEQTPFHATIDTGEFAFDGRKLGLGSSAALAVALAGALCARAQRESPKLEDLIALHREWQGGGSGVDVAASCSGGLSIYRLLDGPPSIERVQWPTELHGCCVWSGQIADTGAQLHRLSDWCAQAPTAYAEHMHGLAQEAENAAAAIRKNDVAGVLHSIAAYANRLREFGNASGLNIFTEGHDALLAIAERDGVVYKPCGAGGDIGIALSADQQRLDEFRRSLKSAGFHEVALKPSDHGLQVRHERFQSAREAKDHAGRHAGRYVATTC